MQDFVHQPYARLQSLGNVARIQGLGVRAYYDLGFRVEGLGFRV